MSNDKHAATFHGADIDAVTESVPGSNALIVMAKVDPDLTPEQDLRAAVAERLVDAVHFGGCTDNPCTCLVGRLRWAIGAEEVASSASETEAAIQTVAKTVSGFLLYTALENRTAYESWEDYPEIGADDWAAVIRRVKAISRGFGGRGPQFDAAYAHLTALSKAWEAEHGGGAA